MIPKTVPRWVGCCVTCQWEGGQCTGPVFAGYQAAHHSEVNHPEKEGLVGYIKKILVENPLPHTIPMRPADIDPEHQWDPEFLANHDPRRIPA